jgi:DNA-binding IclR family transcriptional regulator
MPLDSRRQDALAFHMVEQLDMTGVQSVERALAILRALSTGPAGVTDIADRVELAKSTVSRMLATLERAGAVEQLGGGGPYRLGPLISEISAAAGPGRTLLEAAAPMLAELTAATGEAAGLSVREGDLVRFVLQTRPESEVQVRDWTGTTAPLHVGPSGLVMLAFATPEDVDRYLATPRSGFTERTVTDPSGIRERLERIRVSHVEWVFGEFSLELNSCAAPVFDAGGRPIAALHVHGPTYRFPGDASAEVIGTRLVDAADRLTVAVRGR